MIFKNFRNIAKTEKKTPGERPSDLQRHQLRRKKQRRREIRNKILIFIFIVVAAAVLFFVVRGAAKVIRVQSQEEEANERKENPFIDLANTEILHLSFPQLSVTEGEGRFTVSEFNEILNELYADGYMLVDIDDVVREEKEGFTLNTDTELPKGKKPLILSQRDVSYPLSNMENGYASKLVVTADGRLKCEYIPPDGDGKARSSGGEESGTGAAASEGGTSRSGSTPRDGGTVMTGDFDLVPALETFLATHEDFSYNGARGILGLTGYNGILGYRTAAYLSNFENNIYGEQYGLFDTATEQEGAAAVVDALKDANWRFASCGYYNVSYGSEFPVVSSDIDAWMNEVSPLIGGTELMIFPYRTDIGSWQPYTEENAKFNYLEEKGFRYFFSHSSAQKPVIQLQQNYMRESIYEVNTAGECRAVMNMIDGNGEKEN